MDRVTEGKASSTSICDIAHLLDQEKGRKASLSDIAGRTLTCLRELFVAAVGVADPDRAACLILFGGLQASRVHHGLNILLPAP